MAWRFKASKYKNSVPIVPKIEVKIILLWLYQLLNSTKMNNSSEVWEKIFIFIFK